MSGRNEPRRWKFVFQVLDDVVALDMHRPVMHQHRDEAAGIDPEKPRLHVLVARQIDGMRLPWNLLEVEKYAKLLRAGRAHVMEHMHALPAQHLACPDIALDKLHHRFISRVGPSSLRLPHALYLGRCWSAFRSNSNRTGWAPFAQHVGRNSEAYSAIPRATSLSAPHLSDHADNTNADRPVSGHGFHRFCGSRLTRSSDRRGRVAEYASLFRPTRYNGHATNSSGASIRRE